MTPGGCDAILQEALLLGSYADFWKLATGYTKALCNVYVAPNPYPTPGGGDAADGHNPNSATQNMVKVTTTVPCSLRTFATFITAPRSVRYCEDNVMFCDIIERDNKTKLFHTAYAGDPPCDVVAVHITAAYKVPENTTENNPLCKFVASLRDDKRRGHVPQPLSTIFVYAMKSAEHPKTPPSPPYVRMRFHLSAFIAYEIPGPLVRVVFVHAPGDRTPKMVDRCITKMVCVRNLCQMLEWLNTGGPLTEPVIWENQRPQETPNAHSVGTENTREPNPLVEEPSDVVLQGDNPSSAPGRVFQTLFALHASAAWRLVLQHEGCTVEECEARCCFPAPAFLKAYRFATTIACSLDIFRRLVSDPMQLHRYDPSVEKVELLHSQKGEDTVHIHFKQLSHSAPKQDACILTSNALLQPDEAHRWRLYQLTDNINVVYVQNGIQSTEIPAAGACDRQVVYAMGYVAIPSVKRQPTGAGDGNEGSEALRVYHVVCVDNNTASLADKQLVTIRQHFFRLTGIRNLCEEAKSKPPTCSLPPHTTRDVNDFFESGTLAGFTEVETLEDASLERTSSTNNVRRQLDLVDGMEGYTSHATAHVDTMMNSSSLEKLHQFLLHFAPHYCIEHKQSELDNKLVPAAATLQPSPFTEQQQIYPSVWQAHAPTPDQQKQEVQTAQLVQRGKVSAPPAIQQSGGKAALTWDTSVEEVVPDKQKQEVQTAQLVQCGKVSAPPAIHQIGGKAALTWDTSVEEVVPDKQKQEVQTAQLVQCGKVSAPPAIHQIGGKAALTWDTSVEEVVPDKQKQEVQTAQLVQRGKVSAPPAIQQSGGKAALTWDTSVEEVVPDKQKQEVQTAQLVQCGKVSAPPAIHQIGGKAALTWDTSVEEVVPDKQKQEVQTAQLVQCGKVSAPPAIQQSGGKAALTWDTSVEEVVPDKQKQEVQTAQLVQCGKVSAPPAIHQIGGKAALTWDTSVEEVVPDKQKQEVQTAQLVQRGKVSAPPAIQQSGGKAALTWDTSVEEVVPDKQKQEVQTAQLVQCGKVSAPPAIQQSEKGALDRKEKNVHMKNFMQAIHTEGEPIHRRRDDERLGLQPLQRKKGFQSIPTNLEEEASPVQVIGEESKRNSGEPQPVGGQGDCLARAVREGQEKLTRLTGGWCKGRIEKTSAFGEKDSPVQEVQVKENIPQVTCGLSVWPTPDALKVRREGMSVLKLSQRLELRPARQEPRRQEELIWPMKGGWQGSSGSASDGNEGLLLPMGSRSVDTDDVWEERVKLSDGTFGRKVNNKIQVNVRACRNMPAATQKKHMLSIQISTSSTEAQTGLVPLTLNPIFPHQTILLDEPEDDTVNVTAIVKTEDDRMKRLGEAVVSLRYLHVLDSYTRWISLICNVGTSDAFECGDVCITFRRGTEEGPNGVVSINGKQCEQQQLQWGEAERTQEEEKLRRYVRDVLVSAGNANLHLLEWLVGNCYRKTPGEIDAFIRRYRKDDTIMLTVFEVCGLRTEVGVPLLRPVPCHVLVETSRGSCTTSPVNLQGQAAPLNMVFHLVIGVNEPIRLIVFTGDTAVGETVITTAQDGTRTRVLVSRAGTEEAVPCGTITVGTRRGSVSELTESPKPLRVEVNEENSKRMAYLHHILWMNARSSLHKLDVIAASPLESGRLLEKFGPTAKWYDLRVSLRHWRPTSAAWDSPIVDNTLGTHKREKDGDELLQHVQTVYRRVFAVVHIGLQYHKTFEVRTDCAGEVHFNETFTFSGVCPRRDEVFVSVIGKGLTGTEDHDLGVTVLSMKSLKLQQRTHMTVPLVRQAGTRGARFQGSLYLELFAVNFDGVAANDYEAEMCRPSIRSILYHHAPKELHKAECFLGSYASREKDCLRELRKTYGPDILKLPMAIRLMSLNQLTPYPNSYLKVYLNDTPVIRTEKLSTDDPILFDPEDSKSRARVLVDDVYDVRLRFKVKQTRFLLTKTLCTGDFSLRGMVVSQEGVYWIPLVDNEGVSVGNLCVELKSSAFVYNDTVKRAKDFVEDDVVSLIRRYRPSKVPIMHMIMEKVSNREAAHSEIRREVVTEPVAATVFISVELLSIHRVFFEQTEEDDQQVWPEGETEYVVTAKYGGDESSTTTKNFTPQGNSSTIRLDVRTFRERKAHKLTITVRRQRTLPPPCPVKSSEAQNGKIPRFGPFCKATPVVSKQRPRVIMPQPPSLLHEPEYVGCAVISLRALFTPLLYSTGELVTVPLLYLPPNANGGPAVPDGRDHTGSGVHSEGEVVGNIAFRVRLPAYEQIPSWLQFDATTLEKEIKLDRAAIRYYEERIRNILAEHKSHCLWNMHYRLYEKYVASGHWHRLLRGWRNALLRQFPSANNSNDVPTSSMWYAPSTASDRNLRSDNMNSILERLKGEFSSDDSLMGDVAETEMTGGENSIETGSESESESD